MLWQLRAIAEELVATGARLAREKPVPFFSAAGVVGLVLLWLLLKLFGALFGVGGAVDPFVLVSASGRVIYEDGSPLPQGLIVTFMPQGDAGSSSGLRAGVAPVAANTGAFSTRLRLPRDLKAPYKLRVAIVGNSLRPADPKIVPDGYADLATTALVVETRGSGIEIKIPKPTGQ